jgi:ribosomal protein S17E
MANLPEQNIPDEKKDHEWFVHHARSIYLAASVMQTEKQRDLLCWQLFNGIVNEQDFDYLRKVDNFEYPAKIRHIPILRSRFQRLRALETRRFFKPRVFSVNKAAIQTKIDLKSKAIIDAIVGAYTSRANQLQQVQQQLQQQMQQMDQNGGQNQNPEAAYRIQQMQAQLQQLQQPLQREEILNMGNLCKLRAGSLYAEI